MAKKLKPDQKQHARLVQKLAGLKREQAVRDEMTRLNEQLQQALTKEIDMLNKGMLVGINSELTYEERSIAPSNKIMAIKMVRERCNNGLLEAKQMVDAFLATQHVEKF